MDRAIRVLVRQCARWATAASQDENPMIAVLHANYGAGYLWALSDIASPQQIKDAAGVDYTRLKENVVGVQDSVTKMMSVYCPKYAPKRTYLTELGGE